MPRTMNHTRGKMARFALGFSVSVFFLLFGVSRDVYLDADELVGRDKWNQSKDNIVLFTEGSRGVS